MAREALLEVDEGGGLAGDADVERLAERADCVHQLLGARR